MKARQRAHLSSVFGRFYRRHLHDRVRLDDCFYCGEPAQSLDHVPPLAWVEHKEVAEWKRRGIPLVLVRSCVDCNKRLGDRPFFTTQERCAFLNDRLTAQFERDSLLWSEDEIAEMGHAMQLMIRAKMFEANSLIKRLRHLERMIIDDDVHPSVISEEVKPQ